MIHSHTYPFVVNRGQSWLFVAISYDYVQLGTIGHDAITIDLTLTTTKIIVVKMSTCLKTSLGLVLL